MTVEVVFMVVKMVLRVMNCGRQRQQNMGYNGTYVCIQSIYYSSLVRPLEADIYPGITRTRTSMSFVRHIPVPETFLHWCVL